MTHLTQLADAARAVIAAFDRAGELTDELISALELALNGAELSPATEQSGEAVAWIEIHGSGVIYGVYMNAAEDLPLNVRLNLYTRPQPAPAVPDDGAVRETLLNVIRRLNQNPYSLTKIECIREVEAMLAAAPQPLTCTCPSGDGSLRWPCPRHPPESA
ncbi:hypothetical protein [Chromobacterium subtsugae]|uniref:hypothetical protein n=1 Tax=Chromobacterium subtsugae TaxID=251747 RepID=UPI0007F8B416|nr:hypothetical protein [Chromobacterium subtsugae]OBU86702.1 hypothetical protein MY55_07640 [Chromobacterium subtsugae]